MSSLKANLTLLLTIGLVAGAFAGTALAQESDDAASTNETSTNGTATNDTTTNETVIVVNDSAGNETAPSGNETSTNETAPSGNETGTNETAPAGNETAADDNETSDGPTNPWARYVLSLKDARKAALDQFKTEREVAVADYRARLDAIRESYLENKTAVIDACRADGPGDIANASEDEKEAFAHCVREGLQPLKDEAREDIRTAKDDFRASMKDARKAALGEWKDALREAREQHQAEKREHARSMGKGSGPGSNPHEDRPERSERARNGDDA